MWVLGESLWPGEAGSSLCSECKKEGQDKGEKQFLALLGTEERRAKTRTSS